MKLITKQEIEGMSKAYRRTFMNSVSGFKNSVLVGTADREGRSNLAVFNTCIHLGANPAALAILFRTLSVTRQTYENIKNTGFFTINHIHEEFVAAAHQTSAKYDAGVSEFETCGFTEEWTEGFPAPLVKESKIAIGLSFAEEHTIEVVDTVLVCGRVEFVRIAEELIKPDGYVDAAAAGTVCVNGLDAYHRTELINRFEYARPDKEPAVMRAQ
jgi:flavin reductase (DIM6/NTAB) family NADH-FMN oxidoreductase RutF